MLLAFGTSAPCKAIPLGRNLYGGRQHTTKKRKKEKNDAMLNGKTSLLETMVSEFRTSFWLATWQRSLF